MGLTIHYGLACKTRSAKKARQLVEKLRQRALDLPFQEVGEMIELTGQEACDFENCDQDDPNRWMLVQAGQCVDRSPHRFAVSPTHIVAFSTWAGDGCEEANWIIGSIP